jgi:hypothetical protein
VNERHGHGPTLSDRYITAPLGSIPKKIPYIFLNDEETAKKKTPSAFWHIITNHRGVLFEGSFDHEKISWDVYLRGSG